MIQSEWLQGQIPSFEQRDTLKLNKELKSFSKKNKFSKFIYRLALKSSVENNYPITKQIKTRSLTSDFSSTEGKIIRSVYIYTLDPAGYDVRDTLIKPTGVIKKTINATHKKTASYVIRDLLLFKPFEPFDSLVFTESERLIRNKIYVRDVKLSATVTPGKDSVDIYVYVLDKWSIEVKYEKTETRTTASLNDRNFVGWGHSLLNTYQSEFGVESYDATYIIPSLSNSFIGAFFHYYTDKLKNESIGIGLEKLFYSPLTRWAGGFSFSKNTAMIPDFLLQNTVRSTLVDAWGGYAIPVYKSAGDRSTNAIFTARLLANRIPKTQTPVNDSLSKESKTLMLTGIGMAKRTYRHDIYLYKFGYIEDVPVGWNAGLIAGYQQQFLQSYLYTGITLSYGNYFNGGYVRGQLDYGTFFNSGEATNGAYLCAVNYFTPLLKLGSWYFRQFIRPEILSGIHRNENDFVNINNENGIQGFQSDLLKGKSKITVSILSQAYAPWMVLGFRFGPYLSAEMGMLADDNNSFKRSRLYTQVGIGVLLKNEYLVFNSFQVSFAFYPIIPGQGNNLLKFNSYRITNLGFNDFDLGKPQEIEYR
jgi:hypothetical protein